MRENTERWRQLAEEAVNEQNPERLLELVQEMNELLDKKMDRLRAADRASEPRLNFDSGKRAR